ncbi:hypothetical protein BGX21_003443, partial [Mortierella sp. AD011]
MTTQPQLFCIVEGDSTPFAVGYFPNENIDNLKGRIKDAKQNCLQNIAADKLHLWKAEITIPRHKVADDYYNSYTKDVTKDDSSWLSPNLALSIKIPEEEVNNAFIQVVVRNPQS